MCRYREGELPDIAISLRDVLTPLRAVVGLDSLLAQRLLLQLFRELYSEASAEQVYDLSGALQNAIDAPQRHAGFTSTLHTLALALTHRIRELVVEMDTKGRPIAVKRRGHTLNVNAFVVDPISVGVSATATLTYASGIRLIEEGLLLAIGFPGGTVGRIGGIGMGEGTNASSTIASQGSTASNRRGARSVSGMSGMSAGGSRRGAAVPAAVNTVAWQTSVATMQAQSSDINDAWEALALLYEQMEDMDGVRAIRSRYSEDPLVREATEREVNGDLNGAMKAWMKAHSKAAEADPDRESDEALRTILQAQRLLESLQRWPDLLQYGMGLSLASVQHLEEVEDDMTPPEGLAGTIDNLFNSDNRSSVLRRTLKALTRMVSWELGGAPNDRDGERCRGSRAMLRFIIDKAKADTENLEWLGSQLGHDLGLAFLQLQDIGRAHVAVERGFSAIPERWSSLPSLAGASRHRVINTLLPLRDLQELLAFLRHSIHARETGSRREAQRARSRLAGMLSHFDRCMPSRENDGEDAWETMLSTRHEALRIVKTEVQRLSAPLSSSQTSTLLSSEEMLRLSAAVDSTRRRMQLAAGHAFLHQGNLQVARVYSAIGRGGEADTRDDPLLVQSSLELYAGIMRRYATQATDIERAIERLYRGYTKSYEAMIRCDSSTPPLLLTTIRTVTGSAGRALVSGVLNHSVFPAGVSDLSDIMNATYTTMMENANATLGSPESDQQLAHAAKRRRISPSPSVPEKAAHAPSSQMQACLAFALFADDLLRRHEELLLPQQSGGIPNVAVGTNKASRKEQDEDKETEEEGGSVKVPVPLGGSLLSDGSGGGRMVSEWMTTQPGVNSNADLAGAVVKYVLHAVALGDQAAAEYIPRVLELTSRYEGTRKTFESLTRRIPEWMFLRWTSQLLGALNQRHGASVVPILRRLIAAYPQAVFWPFNTSNSGNALGPHATQLRKMLQPLTLLDSFITALSELQHPHLEVKDALVAAAACEDEEQRDAILQDMVNKVFNTGGVRDNVGGDMGKIWAYYRRGFGDILKTHLKITADGRLPSRVALTKKDIQKADKATREAHAKAMTAARSAKGVSGRGSGRGANTKDAAALYCLHNSFKDLSLVSPWLSSFAVTQSTAQRIEIPGQYENLTAAPRPEEHVHIVSVDNNLLTMKSLRQPKRIIFRGSDEREYMWLVKCGEDLRNDQRIEQLFDVVNSILAKDAGARARSLKLRTYAVVPMSQSVGLLQWVPNTAPLKAVILEALSSLTGSQWQTVPGSEEHSDWVPRVTRKNDVVGGFHALLKLPATKVTEPYSEFVACLPPGLLRMHIANRSLGPEAFFALRDSLARSLAVFNIAGYLCGIGDRHLDNFLIDSSDGAFVGIDFGYAFGTGICNLPIPELIPFRLTPQLRQIMGPLASTTAMELCMVAALAPLQERRSVLLNVMEVFIQEPLMDWMRPATGAKALGLLDDSQEADTLEGGPDTLESDSSNEVVVWYAL